MKVLALASYPVEAAATRYRLQQFIEPLAERGITLEIRPFLGSEDFRRLYRREFLAGNALRIAKAAVMRLIDAAGARNADVVLIQREAMIAGPPVIEWLIARFLRRPMILDLDDATYVSYVSPTYGRVAQALKFPGKTNHLIHWARLATCGNRAIAEYVERQGTIARIVPTVVDTDVFQPRPETNSNEPPVIGWIGTHSTFPYLKSIFPVLTELARTRDFRLKIVGSGEAKVTVAGVTVDHLPWVLDREVEDFRSLDIGLYPIDVSLYSQWAQGKSGFKAIQYMAAGVPYVATPVGASAEIGEAGRTHFFASTHDEWYRALDTLLADPDRRRHMAAAARQHALAHYRLDTQADKLAEALREVFTKQIVSGR